VFTAGAWIVTGGTKTGVMKLVGEAVRDYMLPNDKQKLVAIGIAVLRRIVNWEEIKNAPTAPEEQVRALCGASTLSLSVVCCRTQQER